MGAPEVHRSGHTDVDPGHARPMQPGDHGTGPVPPANRPGHHPVVEQDKPDLGQRFPFEFDPKLGLVARLVGVNAENTYVHVTRSTLLVRFGRWALETPVANVADARPTGPYAWWKVAGPPRLSLADRGITFATTATRGLCITFREPVPAALPTSLLRHPSVTVTPADPDGLAEALEAARTARV